jgi:nucleoside phosphorylase
MPGDLVVGAHYKILCSKAILEARRSLLLSNKAIRYLNDGNSVHVEQLDAPKELVEIATQCCQFAVQKYPTWNAAGWPVSLPSRAPKICEGTLGSQDGWTKGRDELDFIRSEFAVDSEDMESSYIAQIAAKHAVPFLAVRAISNNEYAGTLDKPEIFPAVTAAASRAAIVLASMCRRLAQLEAVH